MSLVRRTGGMYPSFMEDFFDDEWSGQGNMFDTGTKIPAVNVKESDEQFEIQVAAPGMQKDNFDINIENNVLSISAEIKKENEEQDEGGKYTKREFSYSSFRRSFSLPDSVNDEEIKANYENGILKLSIPKKEEARPKPPRQISIDEK
ncbi:Hsp20/alpha crystallin family protein [Pricia sp. S334]|uniref:Hsp20/alpha crystallin family protein n=1 Tax=Pricia mediterranea TaxID=3076079 RepID=A0ABU3L3C7_9FLAO|nr:Hsp20/alpha crystallin family protein [Pricia sp. S334]MDT7827592.1 Hsp20/alpha crystallin family protein [Pricia sp. S334]